jgi:hypothetical protein
MRMSRLVPAVAVGALVAASVTPASAATAGIGSTTGTLAVLDLDAGELLQVDLLTDRGEANTNPALGAPSATARLAAARIASPTLDLTQEVPLVEVQSTGEQQTASQGVTPVENPVLSGTVLPVDLTALVDGDGAVSSIGAGVADVDVLSGILRLTSTELGLGSEAMTAQSDGNRSLDIDGLTVLDLGSLLAGLGIPLSDLPLDTLLALVDSLGLLPELGAALDQLGLPVDLENLSAESLGVLIDDVAAAPELVTTLSGESGSTTCDTTDPVLDVIGALIEQDTSTLCDDVTATVEEITAEVDLEGLLGSTLETVLGVLDGVALLSIEGLDVGVVTTATDSVATSVADVTAVLGGITVGSLSLEGVDLLATVEQLDGVVAQVEGALGGILGSVDPGLADLVDIGLLEEATSVTEEAGAVVADASLTGLRVDVTPDLALLEGLIGSFAATESVGDVLGGLGLPVPVSPVTTFNESLTAAGDGGQVVVLGDGLSVRLASIAQRSTFAPVASAATPEAPPSLPVTGSNDTVVLLVAALAAAGALGLRRVVRTAG